MRQLFWFDFEFYKSSLLESFTLDAGFAALATQLTFTTAPSIADWIEGIQGENSTSFKQTKTYTGVAQSASQASKFDFNPKYYPEYSQDRYVFFSKFEYPSMEAAVRNMPPTYFVYNNSFYKKVNAKIFEKLPDYSKFEKGIYYRKVIGEKLAIRMYPFNKYGSLSSITLYTFPEIVIELNGIDYKFCLDHSADIRSYLLLFGTSFITFALERSDYIYDQNGVFVRQVLKKDEPVIYTEMEEELYVVSNSFEKLDCFNKYIFMVLELYVYYIRFFERWLPEAADSGKDRNV